MSSWENLAQTLLKSAESLPLDPPRAAVLEVLAGYMRDRRIVQEPIRLNFICTHNSRRSHFGQIMAQLLGAYLQIGGLETYSGGTEATAFHPNAVETLMALGVPVTRLDDSDNPHYRIALGPTVTEAFSKKYGDAPNPRSGYAAILVCSSADAACPVVAGADRRIALPFEDPKASDGTPLEAETYRARALQIGTELAWAFSRIQTK